MTVTPPLGPGLRPSPAPASEPPPGSPSESRAALSATRRPALVALGATLLVVLGANLVITSVIDLVGVAAVALGGSGDPLTVVFGLVFAGIAALLVLAGAAIGGLEIAVGIRVWRRFRYAWIEAIAMGAFGLVAALIGLAYPPEPDAPAIVRAAHGPWWATAVAGHVVAVVSVLAARPWFGPLRLPRTDEEAPHWLRRDRFPRLPGRPNRPSARSGAAGAGRPTADAPPGRDGGTG